MATTVKSEQPYTHQESAGVAVLVACSMLSLVSVLGIFVILGMSAVHTHRSSDRTLFVRNQVAKYLCSLLICNVVQAVGGLLNITWIVEGRIYVGVACTAQAATKQIGNIGGAIFTFVIGAHTFNHLFLGRKYSDRTCHIILIVSWALLLLDLCIGNFILAKPEKGPFYGITTAGYWCWISPRYSIDRYTTDHLFMTVSAAFCFILYSLVFFRLRGNIGVSGGYKISFHRRFKVMAGRTSDGTDIMTDDRRLESHLTTVAKQMLWYPIVYTVLVLPIAASRFSAFSGIPVPFSVTIFTASVFMLHGFFNTMLFCKTKDILPGSWRQKFDLGAGRGTKGDVDPSSRTHEAWYTATRPATVGIGTVSAVRSVDVEKGMEIKYVAEPRAAYVSFGSPTSPTLPTSPTSSTLTTSPTSPLRAHGGSGYQVDTHKNETRQLCSQDISPSIHFAVYEGDGDSHLGIEGQLTSIPGTIGWEPPQYPGRISRGHDNVNTNTLPCGVLNCRQSYSPFLSKWRFWRQRQ